MNGFVREIQFHTVDGAFENYKGRRKGIIKAFTHDVDELRRQCDECHVPGKRPGLYAYPSGRWEIRLPAHLSVYLPHSRLHKLPKEETDKNAWLAQVAADSDTLFSVTFYLCSIYGWQAKSSSRLTKVTGDIGYKPIKDLKRKQEGKKAITKQVLPVKTRSKALGIQTRAQTRKSSIKITS
ncbi:PHD finger protein ALFIN-LIKE 6-like [Capsicum galapagoense]